jgi:ornithine carbamoyltransferase
MVPRPNIHHRNLWSVGTLSRSDVLDVLETARRLKQAGLSGLPVTPLRGCNLALLNDAPPAEGAGSLRHAALGLGAQVSHLRPSDARIAPDTADEATARMLGRLYDAIDCESMAPELVARVAHSAGVPVFNGLGSHGHPTRVLAELLNMQDQCGGKALDSLSVCFVGDPRTPCGDGVRLAAQVAGAHPSMLSVASMAWRKRARSLSRWPDMVQHHGAAASISAVGLAMPWPAMSGAEPCTASKIAASGRCWRPAPCPGRPPGRPPDPTGCRRTGWSSPARRTARG